MAVYLRPAPQAAFQISLPFFPWKSHPLRSGGQLAPGWPDHFRQALGAIKIFLFFLTAARKRVAFSPDKALALLPVYLFTSCFARRWKRKLFTRSSHGRAEIRPQNSKPPAKPVVLSQPHKSISPASLSRGTEFYFTCITCGRPAGRSFPPVPLSRPARSACPVPGAPERRAAPPLHAPQLRKQEC